MGTCTSSQPKLKRRATITIPFSEKRKRRVLLIGLDRAGKTTLLLSLAKKITPGERYVTKPTVGFNVETCRMNGLELTVWDVGGQEKQRSQFWRHYFTGVQGLVFVVDSTDEERFSIAASELLAAVRDDQLFFATFLILANKQDQPNAKTKDEIERALNLHSEGATRAALGNRPARVFACSLLSGDGIQESFQWLCDTMLPL
jgi:ADP-ribosylation factor protein 1